MFRAIATFLEMIKFSHTLFALPFALLSALLASYRHGGIRPLDFIGILSCMVFARSAAMGFNRWADWRFDAVNPRTRSRHLPAGLLSTTQVILFVVTCSVGFVLSTLWFVVSSGNWWPMMLSLPTLAVLLGYSYAKRFTSLAHVWLGVALGLSPIAAWVAIRPVIEWTPFLLSGAILFWVAGFDVIYACQDVETDQKLGLRSIPARFGTRNALLIAQLFHFLMFASLVALGMATPELSSFYWLGLVMVAGLLIVEHWLAASRDLQQINIAFFHVNAVISVGLLLMTVIDLAMAD